MFQDIQRYRLNLNHLTLPEIKYFNALGDRFCFRAKAKRFSRHGRPQPCAPSERQ